MNAKENEKVMTPEMKEYVDKKQIFHRRFRREGIDETKRPEETNIEPNRNPSMGGLNVARPKTGVH